MHRQPWSGCFDRQHIHYKPAYKQCWQCQPIFSREQEKSTDATTIKTVTTTTHWWGCWLCILPRPDIRGASANHTHHSRVRLSAVLIPSTPLPLTKDWKKTTTGFKPTRKNRPNPAILSALWLDNSSINRGKSINQEKESKQKIVQDKTRKRQFAKYNVSWMR